MMRELLGDSYTVYLANHAGIVVKRTILPNRVSDIQASDPMSIARAVKRAATLGVAPLPSQES
ncbi:hypothetical protein SEA_HANNACONDA_207 [Mycobacterium phage Hannaconda]|nr:hypothetical protein SEA_HANNACONDA_207 [Mycobacterium phage Hannaconda]QPO16807.1 hypothetical protein SEA_KASHFLOW_208 [Mycobacterium phage KashFlow]